MLIRATVNLNIRKTAIFNYVYCIIYITFILISFFVCSAKFVGMEIEKPNTKNFKSLDPEKTEEIRNYFENNKALKLIIVVISNSPDTIYSEYTVFFIFFNSK